MKRIEYLLLMYCTVFLFSSCASQNPDFFHDPDMDFGSIKTIAVMPFANLTRDDRAADRVRDVFINKLISTEAVYVLPIGEVSRGVSRSETSDPTSPSPEQITKLAGIINADAIITGAVREYGEVRSSTASANLISVSLQMLEAQTGKVIFTASSTKGGISTMDRLLGSGGKPMNIVTEQAVDELINKLFE